MKQQQCHCILNRQISLKPQVTKNMDTAYKREFKFLGICITENKKM